jgi:asparagine synthetase B (glutamine-hydrolysing)
MSVQWGLREFDGVDRWEAFLAVVPPCLQQWGADGYGCWDAANLHIGAQSFHVTLEDLRQEQPFVRDESGNVFTFDGRLDNRAELMLALDTGTTRQSKIRQGTWNPGEICEAGVSLLNDCGTIKPGGRLRQARWLVAGGTEPTDLEIAAAAFDRWNIGSFCRLRGDWAMTAWEKSSDTVHLARDPFGSRHLFYSTTDRYFCWSSRYECLSKLLAGEKFRNAPLTKDRNYAAASVIALPALDASPYEEIRAIPPAHVVSIDHCGEVSILRADAPPAFRPDRSISFEEARHTFRHLLERSLIHRMRSAFPVTLELSGGCDSSTLVCLVKDLQRQGKISAEWRTVTRRPFKSEGSQDVQYAGIVEESVGQRGRRICTYDVPDNEDHVPASGEERAAFDAISNSRLEHSPSLSMRILWNYRAHHSDIITERGGRVLICGIGGDELAGGVQDAAVGLIEEWSGQSLPARAQSLINWARYKNETVWRLLVKVASERLPVGLAAILDGPTRRQARAIRFRFPEFSAWRLAMIRFAFSGAANPLQSRRKQSSAMWPLSPELSHKKRLCHIGSWHRAYPYISQDWVEALAVIPPEYVQAPFQRRRLLRDAVADLVPSPVLWRKTKDFGAFSARSNEKSGGQRLLKNLEEHAEVLQLLKAAQQQTPARAKPQAVAPLDSKPFAHDADDSIHYQPAKHIRFVTADSGGTLLDIRRGKRVVLNPSAAFIWRGIVDMKSGAEISRELATNFEIPHPTALADTREFIGGLMRNDMLRRAGGEELMTDIPSLQEAAP